MNVRFTPRAESEAESKRKWWRKIATIFFRGDRSGDRTLFFVFFMSTRLTVDGKLDSKTAPIVLGFARILSMASASSSSRSSGA